MANQRRASRGKKIKPHFWVFCEGETEEAYICFLRSKYRIPIEIIPKVVGNKISDRFIRSYKKGKPTHPKDLDFLVYDADIEEVTDKLKLIKNTTLILSNPCIELWFLLHYKNQTGEIASISCVRELSNRNKSQYKKGVIDSKLKIKLNEKSSDAIKRAEKLTLFNNPSTNIHELIRILESQK